MFQYWVIVGIVLVWSHWIALGSSPQTTSGLLTFRPCECFWLRWRLNPGLIPDLVLLWIFTICFCFFLFSFFKWLRLETVVTMVAWVFLCSCSLLEVPQPNLSPSVCLSLVSVLVCFFFVGLVWVRNVSTLRLKWRNCSNVFIQYLKYLAAVF